jgi:hypothetical protein
MRAQIILAAALLTSLGCNHSMSPEAPPGQSADHPARDMKKVNAPPAAQAPVLGAKPPDEVARRGAGKEPAAGERGPADAPAQSSLKRRIIYNGTLQLIVKDLDTAESDFKAILREFGALVANSEMTGSAGAPRSGHWRVRVPVERFDEFMAATVKLGVPQRNTTDSQDVSEEYYDLEDRIKNKKLELDTLRDYLKEKRATSRLDEILTIEKELNRVRTELDQLEGRLRRLKDLTALATADVTLQEVKDYVPPQAPTFAGSVQGTFADSIDLLGRFGRGLVIVAVALAPWLMALAAVAVPGWHVGRRYWKKSREISTEKDARV